MKQKKRLFGKAIVNWGNENLRDFSWRHDLSPYKVFIVEFLLKRTTSTAARRIYAEFLVRYPNIQSIADAKLCDIETMLKSIGLYRQRSAGIKKAAEYILDHHNGHLPSNFNDLLKVPHIGSYTAGAIMSFGFDKPAPIIDSNVRRVVIRVFRDSLRDDKSDEPIMEILGDAFPKNKSKLFNWSLIDIGATVCSYRSLKCTQCPLEKFCDHLSATKTKRLEYSKAYIDKAKANSKVLSTLKVPNRYVNLKARSKFLVLSIEQYCPLFCTRTSLHS
ncbi:hypothetical protein ACFLWC_01945 [Chloroflexota bacterium]